MSEKLRFVSEEEQKTLNWAERHEAEYLRSGGAHGQFWDFTMNGGHPWTQCLLLETFGRKTGERRIARVGLHGGSLSALPRVPGKGRSPDSGRGVHAAARGARAQRVK